MDPMEIDLPRLKGAMFVGRVAGVVSNDRVPVILFCGMRRVPLPRALVRR